MRYKISDFCITLFYYIYDRLMRNSMKRKLLFCTTLWFCVTHYVIAQSPFSLLWRISGNGIQKPSYLFGTIHLTDERVFQLGDSLYAAIEKTEGFATEITPEEISSLIMDEFRKELSNSKKIKDQVSSEAYKKYSKVLAEKLKKPAAEITVRDVLKEKNKWTADNYRKGKMTTILDAYLYDVARRQGKWTGGVEDKTDQSSLVRETIDDTDLGWVTTQTEEISAEGTEIMVQLYLSSDLDGIARFSNGNDSIRNELLTKRNIKMARRMDSLSAIRSMVFAVGAAHLPGEDGLIQLLREKGFDLQPVFSAKQISPEDYAITEVVLPWLPVKDSRGFYSVEMPGVPEEVTVASALKMNVFFDIFRSVGYFASVFVSPFDNDTLSGILSKNLFNTQPANAKKVSVDGIEGGEYEMDSQEGYRKGVILNKNSVYYVAYAHSVKRNADTERDITRFLQTFKVVESSPAASMYEHIDSALGYSVLLPELPSQADSLVTDLTDESTRARMSISIDNASGAYFFVGVNEVMPGYYLENDSSHAVAIMVNLKEQTKTVFDTIYIKNNNRIVECIGYSKNQKGIMSRSYHEIRGNRWYGLVAMYNPEKPSSFVEPFFNSFKLLPYPDLRWSIHTSEDKKVTTWSPGNIELYKNDLESDTSFVRYTSFDSVHANSFDIMIKSFGKYYWQPSDSIFWDKIVKEALSYNDTLLHKSPIVSNGKKGVEMTVSQKGSGHIQRIRKLLSSTDIITVYVSMPGQDIRGNDVGRFFDNLIVNTAEIDTGFVFRSKAALLLKDINSADSATQAEALAALTASTPFDNTDIPLLHEALLNPPDADSNSYYRSSDYIVAHLRTLAQNETLTFAYKNFDSAQNDIKANLLNIISGFATEENYKEMITLLKADHSSFEPGFSFANNLIEYDSVSVAVLPALLTLLDDGKYTGPLSRVILHLLEDSLIEIESIRPYEKTWLTYAEKWRMENQTGGSYEYDQLRVLSLLGRFKSPESNAMLRKWSMLPADVAAYRSLQLLLGNKQQIPKSLFERFAAHREYRVSFYEDLEKYKLSSRFPKKYRTQKHFAESRVYTFAADDYEVSAINFLKAEEVEFKGKKQIFYFFKVSMAEEDISYLATVGPFSDKKVLTNAVHYDDMLTDEVFDMDEYEAQKNKLLDAIAGWAE